MIANAFFCTISSCLLCSWVRPEVKTGAANSKVERTRVWKTFTSWSRDPPRFLNLTSTQSLPVARCVMSLTWAVQLRLLDRVTPRSLVSYMTSSGSCSGKCSCGRMWPTYIVVSNKLKNNDFICVYKVGFHNFTVLDQTLRCWFSMEGGG